MTVFEKGWYLIYTMHQQENKVASQLEKKNINYFLPKISSVRQLNDRKKIVETPLFPNYIFIYLDGFTSYFESQSVKGFCCFVRTGKKISKVPFTVIDQLNFIVNCGTNVSISQEKFPAGKKFYINNGGLRGLHCETVYHNGEERILVRLFMLNRDLLVDLPPDFLSVPQEMC